MLATEGSPSLGRGSGGAGELVNVSGSSISVDSVATNPESAVSIALTPDALVKVLPSSQLAILALSVRKDGDETSSDSMRQRDKHLELKRGGLIASQERPDVQAVPHFTIETPRGILRTNFDCTFLVEADESSTRIVCASGLLAFTPRGETTGFQLEGGSFGAWSESGGTIAAAETDSHAQTDLATVLREAENLRRLRDARRNKWPPAAAKTKR